MSFDLKFHLSVSSSPKSHQGESMMGEWAEAAAKRFQQTASQTRRDEELELVRHHKTVAGAEKLWDSLVAFIASEVQDFNRRMEREFLVIYKSQNEIGVEAPELRLSVELDRRTPTLDFKYLERSPNREEKESGEYRFRLKDNDVLIFGQYDKETPLSVETVGGELLDPLAV